MTKRKDPDFLALKQADKAVQKCTCNRMIRATLEYLWDKYVVHCKKGAKHE